jgi:histidyl-tRNA synthetase
MIEIASTLLKAYGATEDMFTIRVANRGLLETAFDAAGLNPEQKHAYRVLLDKKPKMDPAEFTSQAAAITDKDPLAIMEDGDPGVQQAHDELDQVLASLKDRGVGNAWFDPTIVRGFDYYTGVVFEIYDTSGENNRSLFGGGRYDYLVGEYGGEDVPAIGFAVSDVIIQDFLTTHRLLPDLTRSDTLYLAPVTEADAESAARVADTLRKGGLNVALGMKHAKIGDHIKAAEKLGIPLFAAYGEKEAVAGAIEIKNLATGKTETRSL